MKILPTEKNIPNTVSKGLKQAPALKAETLPAESSSKTLLQQVPPELAPALPHATSPATLSNAAKNDKRPICKQLQNARAPPHSHADFPSDSDEELVYEPPEFFDEHADDDDQKWMDTSSMGLL